MKNGLMFWFPVNKEHPKMAARYNILLPLFILGKYRYYFDMEKLVTINASQTKKLGELLAEEIKPGTLICLSGDLGSGKTTFTQGLLKGLKIKGPYTSPTFVIMKNYKNNIFHFDAYRVSNKDILNLGWEELIANPKNIVIVEWADRIKKIIPKRSLWIKFEWQDENKRKVIFGK
jgi:tRNA threonylcarbamoyladenosine biosynthesis protein TsaE